MQWVGPDLNLGPQLEASALSDGLQDNPQINSTDINKLTMIIIIQNIINKYLYCAHICKVS